MNYKRRSISAFGDVITRYEYKMMENDRKGLSKSVNRYEKRNERNEKSNHAKLLDLQVKRSKKTYSATIDFSQNF